MKFETISDNDLLNNANNREVGFAEASLARLGQTFEIDNTMGTVVNEAKVAWESLKELSAGYDPNQPTLEDTINARARGEDATFQPQELEKISQEDFAKEGFGEFGAKWNEDMTRARAGIERETSERLKRYQMIGEQADLNPVYGFGLDIVANVVDPINFVGLGPSSKIAGVGKKVLASGAAAGMENLAVSAINRPYWEERGIESTWVDYTMDGLMGFGLGGLMGGAQHLIQTRKLRSKVKPETKMTVAKIQAQTIEQIRNNDKVDWSNIPDADKAIGEIFNLPEKEAALSFRQNAKRISESLGISEEDALAQQLPALLHMRDFRAKQTGEDFNELVTSFVIENVKSKNKKAVGIEFDLKAENAQRVESKLLDDEVGQMLTEVQSGVKGERSGKMMDVGDGYEFINTSTQSTYPKWYRDIGVKSKEHFEKIVSSRKGPIWKRIKEIAQDRLENGGADGEGIPFEPSNEWRKLKGMEPVLLNQDSAPSRVTGEVIEFDGAEGVIKLADGERVYFDAESIRKGRSLPGVGEKVEVSLEEGAEFPMAETLYQSNSRRRSGTQWEVNKENWPDDFETVNIPKQRRSFMLGQKEDLKVQLDQTMPDKLIFNDSLGEEIKISDYGRGKISSFIVNTGRGNGLKGSDLRLDYALVSTKIDDVIANAHHVENGVNTKPERGRGDFNYLLSEVNIRGRKYLVQLQVVSKGGEKELYNYKLSRIDDMSGAAKVATSNTGVTKGPIPPDTDIVTPFVKKFNESKSKFFQLDSESSPRGQIDFLDDGTSLISLHKGADNTTVLHEQGHFFLNSFEEVVNSGKANKQTLSDWKTTQNWLDKQDYKASKADIDSMVKKLKEKDFPLKGHELRKFARDKVEEINRHEFFARGFEQYMRDGNAPYAGVARVFEKFRDWFRGIYKSRESLNADITPEMRDVYTRLMGGEKTLSLKGELPTPKARLTPEERVLSDDFDSFIESYNQGALDEFDTKAVEDVLQFENTVTKAQDIYKKIGELTSLYQKPLDMADQIAGEFEIPKSEAKEMVDGVLGLVVEDGPERARQIATILSTLSEGLDRQKALEKRNAAFSLRARQNLKGFVDKIIKENYQDKGKWKTFVESNGTPERAILATLEGDSRMRGVQGAGQAVYADYQGLSQYWTQSLMSEMEKVDPNIEKLFSKDPTLNENVVREMWEIRSDGSGNPGITGDSRAKKIAELFSKMSEETRTRLNDAGADIGKLDGWVPRRHDYEKMVLAGRDGWIADIRSKLDIERSFPWVKNEDELLEALGETYDNLVTGIHEINDLPGLNDAVAPSPANIAKRMGKTRKLHFTDSGSELEYLKKYAGAYNIAETMFSHLDRSARTASLMERLGPNPDNTIISVIDQVKEGLRKGEYGIPQDKVQELVKQLPNRQQLAARETNIGRAMSVVTGENQLVENVTMANVSGAIRSINTLSKLMAATLSQFSDALSVANEMRIIKDQGYAGAWNDTLKAYFKKMSPEQKTNVLDKLGIMSDGFNLASFNRFDAADNLNSKFARAMDKGFKMSGMTQLTNKIKSGFGLALSKEFGENLDKSFDDLAPGIKEVLSQYGSIDASKWDIIRSSQGIDVDGQKFLTPDSIRKLEDEAFDNLLPEELRVTSLFEGADSKLEAKRATEIKRIKRELEQSLRTVFVEETRNAVLEPDARVMRTTTGGYKRGTTAGEAWRLMNQFKSFTYAYTQRTLGGKRMMKKEGDYGGVVHHALMGGLLGYMSMVAKDLSKGKEPRDPTSSATWAAAMAQSGGAGIIGDLAFNDANRFGGGILATLGGPTLGTAEDLYKLTIGNMHKAVAGEKTDFLSDSVNFIQRNNPIPHANLWYTRTAMNYLFWYQLREALNPGSIRRMERRVKKDNNQEYLLSPSSLVR